MMLACMGDTYNNTSITCREREQFIGLVLFRPVDSGPHDPECKKQIFSLYMVYAVL